MELKSVEITDDKKLRIVVVDGLELLLDTRLIAAALGDQSPMLISMLQAALSAKATVEVRKYMARSKAEEGASVAVGTMASWGNEFEAAGKEWKALGEDLDPDVPLPGEE